MNRIVLCILFMLALFVISCAPPKQLIQKDTEMKTDISNKTAEQMIEERESVYVYDLVKKESYWMNKTADAGKLCKVAAECEGWCEPVEGQKEGKCSWFSKPIGCKKRLERAEIFDVCMNLTIKG